MEGGDAENARAKNPEVAQDDRGGKLEVGKLRRVKCGSGKWECKTWHRNVPGRYSLLSRWLLHGWVTVYRQINHLRI